MATRPLSSPELALLRADGQKSRLYLAIRKPSTIYTAHLYTPYPTTTDMVGQVSYGSGSGTLANIQSGMTMYVGSTAGGRDYGICRIRKTPTSSIFYIGEGSEIDWVTAGVNIGLGQTVYLTIVDEFGLWARHIKIVAKVPYMDFDVAYSNQHTNFDPVVLMGPDEIILWLTGATVSITWPTAAGSYDPSGVASISSYLWTAPGASATSGLTTATPTFTYNAAGQYKTYCTITLSNGKSFTASRTVFVYSSASMPETNFALTSNPRGSYENGGWSFEVELYANADTLNIADRTKVILFARDFYGTSEQSIGPIVGAENIVCTGWIEGDSIDWNYEAGTVRFTVSGAQEWLKKIPSFPVGLERIGATSTGWTNIKQLTPRLFLWNLLHWRSTADAIMDINLTTDTRQMKSLDTQQANLWAQITAIARDQILADPIVDRYGQFYCKIFQQLQPTASRSTIPTVMQILKSDWHDGIQIARLEVSQTARVELSGVVIGSGTPKALFSLAPGHVFKRYGEVINADYLLLSSQAQANELAGLILAHNNCPLEFDISLAMNNRMIDIAPASYLYISVAAGDTPRGIAYTGNLVPVEVEYEFDENGACSVNVHFEQETFPELYQNGDIPPNPIPPEPIPPIPPIPPVPPGGGVTPVPPASGPQHVAILTRAHGIWYTNTFNTSSPEWFSWNSGLTPADFPDFWKFEMSMVSPHRGFLHIVKEDVSSELWTSLSPGQPWVKIVDGPMCSALLGVPAQPGWFCSFGINRSADGEFGAIIAAIGGASVRDVRAAIGGASGLISCAPTRTANAPRTTGGDVVYGANGWLGHYIDGSFTQMIRHTFSRGAGDFIDTELADLYSGPGVGQTLINCALSGLNVFKPNQGTFYLHTSIFTSPFTNLGTGASASNLTPWRHECIANSPSGLFLLACDGSGFPKRSSDGGVTWSGGVGIVGVVRAIWNCGDDNSFIASIIGQIQYSSDFGATFSQKTGDLQSNTSSLVDFVAIRSYDDLVPS